jgi:hypothetical protein
MKTILVVFCLLLICSSKDCTIEDGWMGLKLFQSGKDDVERLFGNPQNNGGKTTYKTKDSLIHVTYSSSPCSDLNSINGRYNVVKNSIITMTVVFTDDINISDIKWKKSDYKRFEDTEVLQFVYYVNEKKGIMITTIKQEGNKEKIQTIRFSPTNDMLEKYLCK